MPNVSRSLNEPRCRQDASHPALDSWTWEEFRSAWRTRRALGVFHPAPLTEVYASSSRGIEGTTVKTLRSEKSAREQGSLARGGARQEIFLSRHERAVVIFCETICDRLVGLYMVKGINNNCRY